MSFTWTTDTFVVYNSTMVAVLHVVPVVHVDYLSSVRRLLLYIFVTVTDSHPSPSFTSFMAPSLVSFSTLRTNIIFLQFPMGLITIQ